MTDDSKYDHVTELLRSIKDFIENELHDKRELITRLQTEVDHLKLELETFQFLTSTKDHQLEHSLQVNEGNKQLINKLLGDISRLQHDIEWYKRTYEERSFLGTIKEKLKRKS